MDFKDKTPHKIAVFYEDREENVTGDQLLKWLANYQKLRADALPQNNDPFLSNPVVFNVFPYAKKSKDILDPMRDMTNEDVPKTKEPEA